MLCERREETKDIAGITWSHLYAIKERWRNKTWA